jgi:hypothetical protein
MRPYEKQATWALQNMKKALSMLELLNTPEEAQRLKDVTAELKTRSKEKGKRS